MGRIATILLSLSMLAGALAALPTAASADSGVTVNIRTLGADSGAKLTGACYQIVDASNVGCDENDDGDVWFKDMAPGTYTVTQQHTPDGYQAAADFQITVVAGIANQVFPNYLDPVYGTGSVDVAIVSQDESTGQRLTGACYQIVGWSNVGCDVNGDGQVDFADIPVGTYQVEIIQKPDGYTPEAQSMELDVTDQGGARLFHTIYYLSPEQICPEC